jgi:N-acetylmuramoyl-L-alanine amidase
MPAIRHLLAILFLLLPVAAMAKPAVTEARIGVTSTVTRIELQLSAAVKFHTFYLANPYRLVIDLDEVDWKVPGGQKLQGSGWVSGMRYGLFKPGTSRVVLDLTKPARVGRSSLEGGAGKAAILGIDLQATSDADFLLAVKGGKTGPVVAAKAADKPAMTVATKDDGKEKGVDPVNALTPVGDQPSASDPVASTGKAAGKTASVTKKSKALKPLVVIDPGHGGVDPGALGANSVKEKNITLAVAKALKKELQSTGRYRVMMTRDSDVYIPLRDRFKVARDNGADLFISLHADSHNNPLMRGASVYTLSETASDSEAAALAAQENKSDIIAGVDLSKQSGMVTDILIDLAQRDTINLSSRFASDLVSELKADTLLLEHTHRSAGFAVLKAPDVPSVLLEMGYISSTKDQALLVNKKHQAQLAKAIRRAIDDFFDWHELVKRS